MTMITITLNCFGPFRHWGDRLQQVLPAPACVADLRAALQARLDQQGPADLAELLPRSCFASSTQILAETATLQAGDALAIIAPVSGG